MCVDGSDVTAPVLAVCGWICSGVIWGAKGKGLTLKLMSPFLQHRQASMRKTKVKRPEKETATTAREDDQESSLSGAPSAGERRHCDVIQATGPQQRRGHISRFHLATIV